MRILVMGSGGREHALVWKLRQSARVERVYCVPGNAGIAREAQIERGEILNASHMADLAERVRADLTVVGPEAPLVAGVADEFAARGLAVIGPSRAAAQLEGSKIFAKRFMERHRIPTAEFAVCESFDEGRRAIEGDRFGFPVVLKADGLAAGKGVVVARDRQEATQTIEKMMSAKLVGEAGRRVVVERFLPGEEVTFTVLTDGRTAVALAPTQDHKAVFDGDKGPNTGGMGAYCDDAILSNELREKIMDEIVRRTLAGMAAEASLYRGFLYVGLMMTAEGPRVLEFNVRLGDPETQPLMMRMKSDFADLLEAAARGKLADQRIEWTPGATVCVVATSAGYPGDFEHDKPISGIDAAEQLTGVKVFHAGTRETDGQLVTAGGRVLGITAPSRDLSDAISRAYSAVERIHFDGMHYRHDIGQKGLAKGRAQ